MSASQQAIQNSVLPVRKVAMQTQVEASKVNPDGFTNPVSRFGQDGHGINPINNSKKISSKIIPTGFF